MAEAVGRAQIRLALLAPPDKRRPVLVLTRASILPYVNFATVAPITSSIRAIPSEVRLTEKDGMKSPCVVLLDQVQTIRKEALGKLVARLSDEKMAEVRAAILFALGY